MVFDAITALNRKDVAGKQVHDTWLQKEPQINK